ncbi:MAG: hypothetical protein J6M18_04635 [Actinomycetaceae bacterium]|nr:hypothetical protein [Actinomycetaceae bacterium]
MNRNLILKKKSLFAVFAGFLTIICMVLIVFSPASAAENTYQSNTIKISKFDQWRMNRNASVQELEEGFNLIESIPDEVLMQGDDALKKWTEEKHMTPTRASFWSCSIALASLVAGNLVAAGKLLRIKQYIKALGGVKKAVYLMWKGSFRSEKLIKAGGALGALIAEITGVAAVKKACFK